MMLLAPAGFSDDLVELLGIHPLGGFNNLLAIAAALPDRPLGGRFLKIFEHVGQLATARATLGQLGNTVLLEGGSVVAGDH